MKAKLLEALELDKKGDWVGAHKIVQDVGNQTAYWIHAYLHRKEPDLTLLTGISGQKEQCQIIVLKRNGRKFMIILFPTSLRNP